MDHAEHSDSAPAALARALDRYTQWLDYHIGLQIDEADSGGSGASLLHAVAEIRRHHCPGANQLMTDLLLGHTKLSALLFDHELKLVRGQPTEPLAMSMDFMNLVEAQKTTVQFMRTACVTQRGMCIHTVSSIKNPAHQIIVRTPSLNKPGPPPA